MRITRTVTASISSAAANLSQRQLATRFALRANWHPWMVRSRFVEWITLSSAPTFNSALVAGGVFVVFGPGPVEPGRAVPLRCPSAGAWPSNS